MKPYQEHPNFLGFFDHEDIAMELNSEIEAYEEGSNDRMDIDTPADKRPPDISIKEVMPKDLMPGGKHEALYHGYMVMKLGILQNVWDNMYDFQITNMPMKDASTLQYWETIMTEARLRKTGNLIEEHIPIDEIFELPRHLNSRMHMQGSPYCSSLIEMQCQPRNQSSTSLS